ncbi:MAG: cytidylate kinase-like family protein [Paludibacteraceae bacterium]|nr:cytidylate kinase-like family protein [Paludibacteraceae bacterium]
MDEKYVINIGRQLGSGGREIGKKLAKELGIAYYDKELIQEAAKESGLSEEVFEKADEDNKHSIISNLFGIRIPLIGDESLNKNILSNDTLFQIQSDVIKNMAEDHSCIFVGRCADYILRENPRCVNVFISSSIEERIRQIESLYNLTEDKAKELIERTDKKRAGYYNYYTTKTWGAASSYHLCIDATALGIDETVNFIIQFAKKKLG